MEQNGSQYLVAAEPSRAQPAAPSRPTPSTPHPRPLPPPAPHHPPPPSHSPSSPSPPRWTPSSLHHHHVTNTSSSQTGGNVCGWSAAVTIHTQHDSLTQPPLCWSGSCHRIYNARHSSSSSIQISVEAQISRVTNDTQVLGNVRTYER